MDFGDIPEHQQDSIYKRYFATKTISLEEYEELVSWKMAFIAQSRKLQAVLHIPGVKEVLKELDWD